ncbi:MAG: ATP-binding protein [Carbonactinosporaceae bacterium]
MKIAFAGKGGSGKTALTSLLARHLAAQGLPVVAIDADINQHLAGALGLDEPEGARLPALGAHLTEIKDYLRGDNPRIRSAASMIKTTPPGRGSRLLRPTEDDPLHARFVRDVGGVRLMVTGPFQDDDLGVACYHSKVGAVELYLNHLVDGPGEYVVVDMTAGAGSFASGLFTRFDLTFLVAEPTRQGVGVYQQYRRHAQDHGVRLAVVGNKVQGPDDIMFLREQVGGDLLVCLEQSPFIKELDRGRLLPLERLERANVAAIELLRASADAVTRDWALFTRQARDFHLRNARAWGNGAVGEDLTRQIDPDFTLDPDAVPAAPR